jgi:hypothetical protein
MVDPFTLFLHMINGEMEGGEEEEGTKISMMLML